MPVLSGKDESPPRVLLDSDPAGMDAAKKLRAGQIYAGDNGKRVTNVGDLLDGIANAESEDLIPRNLMIDVVARLYRAEEDFAPTAGKPIVPEIEAYAAKHAIPLATPGWKVDVARAVKARLLKMKDSLPEEILVCWTKLFESFV